MGNSSCVMGSVRGISAESISRTSAAPGIKRSQYVLTMGPLCLGALISDLCWCLSARSLVTVLSSHRQRGPEQI